MPPLTPIPIDGGHAHAFSKIQVRAEDTEKHSPNRLPWIIIIGSIGLIAFIGIAIGVRHFFRRRKKSNAHVLPTSARNSKDLNGSGSNHKLKTITPLPAVHKRHSRQDVETSNGAVGSMLGMEGSPYLSATSSTLETRDSQETICEHRPSIDGRIMANHRYSHASASNYKIGLDNFMSASLRRSMRRSCIRVPNPSELQTIYTNEELQNARDSEIEPVQQNPGFAMEPLLPIRPPQATAATQHRGKAPRAVASSSSIMEAFNKLNGHKGSGSVSGSTVNEGTAQRSSIRVVTPGAALHPQHSWRRHRGPTPTFHARNGSENWVIYPIY